MGKRYYCDYCDRSFKDDAEARKKHLSSLQHSRNRSEHYERFKDPATLLNEERAKTRCKRFFTHGECAFGNGCRFSHYTAQMMWELERHVAASSSGRNNAPPPPPPPPPPTSDLINEYFNDSAKDPTISEEVPDDWNFPVELRNYTNLPPSLWPVTPETVTSSNFGRWGF